MGFRPQKKVYKLVFEDPELEGLEVRATSAPMGVFLDSLSEFSDLEGESGKNKAAAKAAMATAAVTSFEKQLATFVDCLLSWNLEYDDGTPVPTTVEGLRSQEMDLVSTILQAWQEAIGGVSGPLDEKSTSGGTSLVASLPMEALSESRAS